MSTEFLLLTGDELMGFRIGTVVLGASGPKPDYGVGLAMQRSVNGWQAVGSDGTSDLSGAPAKPYRILFEPTTSKRAPKPGGSV